MARECGCGAQMWAVACPCCQMPRVMPDRTLAPFIRDVERRCGEYANGERHAWRHDGMAGRSRCCCKLQESVVGRINAAAGCMQSKHKTQPRRRLVAQSRSPFLSRVKITERSPKTRWSCCGLDRTLITYPPDVIGDWAAGKAFGMCDMA